MSITRPRSQTISEGDWVTLNETIRDLSFAVNQLADAAAQAPAYAATVSLRSDQTSISVPLDGNGVYQWSLAGAAGAVATMFIDCSDGGVVSWATWTISTTITRRTGSGAAGELGVSSATDSFVFDGIVASASTGWTYSAYGKTFASNTSRAQGQGNRPLGRLLQFTGRFDAGTSLSVRRVG